MSVPFLPPKYHFDRRPKRSRVAILNVDQYSPKLENILEAALQLFPMDVVERLCSSSPISLTIFQATPLTPTRYWLLLRPNAFAVWARNLFWWRKDQAISATYTWFSPRPDMRTVFAVRRSVKHEEHIRSCAWDEIRMAQKTSFIGQVFNKVSSTFLQLFQSNS